MSAKGKASFDQQLGARVRERRLAAGLRQEELAIAIGKSFAQVSRYERGDSSIDAETLVHLARALKCSASELTGEEGKQ